MRQWRIFFLWTFNHMVQFLFGGYYINNVACALFRFHEQSVTAGVLGNPEPMLSHWTYLNRIWLRTSMKYMVKWGPIRRDCLYSSLDIPWEGPFLCCTQSGDSTANVTRADSAEVSCWWDRLSASGKSSFTFPLVRIILHPCYIS